MVDSLLEDADSTNASTVDRMFAAINGADNRGAPGSDAQGARVCVRALEGGGVVLRIK